MVRSPVLPQAEIRRRVQRLREDPAPVISFRLFAELVGSAERHLMDVLVYEKYPMTEVLQIRLSRALKRLENGEIVVMQMKNRVREIVHLNKPKPRMRRSMGLTLRDGEIKLKIGLRNRGDYSEPTFQELIDGDK